MIHGYDDSTKEKVEVYPKSDVYNKTEVYTKAEAVPASDFVLIEGTFENVPSNEGTTITLTASDIGISDSNLKKWMVISALYSDSFDTRWRADVHDEVYRLHEYNRESYQLNPSVYMEYSITIGIFNRTDYTRNFNYRVLLKKVKN